MFHNTTASSSISTLYANLTRKSLQTPLQLPTSQLPIASSIKTTTVDVDGSDFIDNTLAEQNDPVEVLTDSFSTPREISQFNTPLNSKLKSISLYLNENETENDILNEIEHEMDLELDMMDMMVSESQNLHVAVSAHAKEAEVKALETVQATLQEEVRKEWLTDTKNSSRRVKKSTDNIIKRNNNIFADNFGLFKGRPFLNWIRNRYPVFPQTPVPTTSGYTYDKPTIPFEYPTTSPIPTFSVNLLENNHSETNIYDNTTVHEVFIGHSKNYFPTEQPLHTTAYHHGTVTVVSNEHDGIIKTPRPYFGITEIEHTVTEQPQAETLSGYSNVKTSGREHTTVSSIHSQGGDEAGFVEYDTTETITEDDSEEFEDFDYDGSGEEEEYENDTEGGIVTTTELTSVGGNTEKTHKEDIRKSLPSIFDVNQSSGLSCSRNKDCPKTEKCWSEQCVNPCSGLVCPGNSVCQVKSHVALCTCPEGYGGRDCSQGI